MIPESVHLNIGSLLFEDLDQIDLTGPFEVLSRLPNSTHCIYAKTMAPVRDVMGLCIMPDATLAEAPQLDILHVPGGPGQQALMEDEEVLGWLRSQAEGAKRVLSVRKRQMSAIISSHQQNLAARYAGGKQGVTLAGRSGWEDFFI